MTVLERLARNHPMTWLSTGYVVIAFVLVASGVIDGGDRNLMRLTVAGFLLIAAAAIAIIGLTAHRLHDGTYDGLPPNIVVLITSAASLTILWVCVELWARTADTHFRSPVATIWAAVAAGLWCLSLAALLAYQARKLAEKQR